MTFRKLAFWCMPLCILAAAAFVYFPDVATSNPTVIGQTVSEKVTTEEQPQDYLQPLFTQETPTETRKEELAEIQDTNPWISLASTELSSELYDFIESEHLRYVDISTYPFDLETESRLRALSQSGEILMFDNTEADRLSGLTETPSDIVSRYFGTAAEADVIIATSVKTSDGGIHYLVLPVAKQEEADSLPEDIKVAVALLKQEKVTRKTM
ncbi:hypothetical protein BTA51_14760 [Hahella sp. CCB-MM4]|uniref:hypothetical protein n=1 Tax=Hahella sp. (strain CCB-MM4) TaxID=1926491 RepID=UPI000B9B7A48|nr:hypothetical protein [Hahella sp. CCB-MM4]OZG72779.1 hypothetical protein BTA51_14760 [Hahella sp. CCB-MM4]